MSVQRGRVGFPDGCQQCGKLCSNGPTGCSSPQGDIQLTPCLLHQHTACFRIEPPCMLMPLHISICRSAVGCCVAGASAAAAGATASCTAAAPGAARSCNRRWRPRRALLAVPQVPHHQLPGAARVQPVRHLGRAGDAHHTRQGRRRPGELAADAT